MVIQIFILLLNGSIVLIIEQDSWDVLESVNPSYTELLNNPDDAIIDFVPLSTIDLNPIPCHSHSPSTKSAPDCL